MTQPTPPLDLKAMSDELDAEQDGGEPLLADTIRERMPKWWWITAGLVLGILAGWFVIAPILAPLFRHG